MQTEASGTQVQAPRPQAEEPAYPALPATPRIGDERFHGDHALGLTVLDFWRWAASDLVGNAMRGVLAEFLVASALGLAHGVRAEWEPFDLLTPAGLRVEVKSAAYLQSWSHRRLSTITFGVRLTRLVDADTGAVAREARRQADVYVFCLLGHRDKATLDPLDVRQWQFYVLPASVLDARLPLQKSVSLSTLLALGPEAVGYDGIAAAVGDIESVQGDTGSGSGERRGVA